MPSLHRFGCQRGRPVPSVFRAKAAAFRPPNAPFPREQRAERLPERLRQPLQPEQEREPLPQERQEPDRTVPEPFAKRGT